MKVNIEEVKERQELHRKFERKEISEEKYKAELLYLDNEIRNKLDLILNTEVKEKIDSIKENTIRQANISKYKLYKEIVELHRKAKDICKDIKEFKKEFSEDKKKC